MSPPVEVRPPASRPTRRSERAARVGLVVAIAAAAMLGLWIMVAVVFRDPAFVERVRVDNPTGYDINVVVTDARSTLPLGVAGQRCTTQFQDVLDPGATWIIRFSTQGRDGGEVSVSRAELEQHGWTLRVPDEVIERLTASGAPPAPRHSCVQ